MKKLFIIFAAAAVVACNSSKEKNKVVKSSSNMMTSENSKKQVNDTIAYEDSVMLLGEATREGFKMDAFKEWYNLGYDYYKPKPEIIDSLKPLLKDVQITVFMGTWCEDSQRETPHLYKILDQANFDEDKLTLYTVSDEKTTPQGFEEGKDINYVPTIIFYKNGEELNRIVEYPMKNLEADMLTILSGKEYQHAYAQ